MSGRTHPTGATLRGTTPWSLPRPYHPGSTLEDALRRLRADGWVVLSDVAWPEHRAATIDHVLVGPGGVVVVRERSVAGGPASGRVDRGLEHDLREASSAAGSVTAVLPPAHRTATRAVVVLPDADALPAPQAGGIPTMGGRHLTTHLRRLPVRLSVAEAADAAAHLRRELPRRTRLGAGPSGRGARVLRLAVYVTVGALALAVLAPGLEPLAAALTSLSGALFP